MTPRLALLLGTVTFTFGLACTRTVYVTGDRPTPAPNPPPAPVVVVERPTVAALDIPPGHMPRVGECRIWIPGNPPGRQPRPRSRSCQGIVQVAPLGSWIVYRPSRDRRYVHVRLVDQRRAGVIRLVRVFDYDSGRFIREEQPEPEYRPRDDVPWPDRPREQPAPTQPTSTHEQPSPDRPARPVAFSPLLPKLDIPANHLPPIGTCRVWIPKLPAAQQRYAASSNCLGVKQQAPAASWVVYRPATDHGVVHLRIVDERRPGVYTAVRVFELQSGRYLGEVTPPVEVAQQPAPQQPPPTDDRRPGIFRPGERPPAPVAPAQPPPQPAPAPRPEKPPFQPAPQPTPQPVAPPQQPAPQPAPEPVAPAPQPVPQPVAPPLQPAPERPRPSDEGESGARLDVPPGHFPDVGQCRVWLVGTPPGRNRAPASNDCQGVTRTAPAGSWVLYRPSADEIHVRVIDAQRAGVVTVVRVYEAPTRRFVREQQP